jgi:stalled ribosome rescue protein Dom34
MVAEIVKTINKSWEYYLLVLSESPTKLFKGNRELLTEIKDEFPLFHTGRGGSAAVPTAFGKQTAVILDEEHRKFFRKVSEELTKVKLGDSLPVIVTGVDRFLSFWSEVAPEELSSSQIRGSYDFMSDSELIKLAWPEVQKVFQAKNLEVLKRLDIAIGNNTYAGGFEEVIEMAQLGRVAELVISNEEIANPLSEIAIRLTLEGGGEVTFIPAVELADFAGISADLRF